LEGATKPAIVFLDGDPGCAASADAGLPFVSFTARGFGSLEFQFYFVFQIFHACDYTCRMDKWEKLAGKPITACGGILADPTRYAHRQYKGVRIYFCSAECLQEFERDPDGFMTSCKPHPVAREGIDPLQTGAGQQGARSD
jgi:YHS domain-containing protein